MQMRIFCTRNFSELFRKVSLLDDLQDFSFTCCEVQSITEMCKYIRPLVTHEACGIVCVGRGAVLSGRRE